MMTIRVAADEMKRFCLQALTHAGVRPEVAEPVAEGLVQTSLRGVDSHGVRLLPHYLRAVRAGRLNPNPAFRFERAAPAAGRLDGDHTFGHAAGAEGMRHAMELAREAGLGAVAVHNSSHFGAAAYFALMAAEQGFIGLAFTHADALMVSYGGQRAYFGTNPICFAAPCADEEPFCLDMATSRATWNKLLILREAHEPVPAGWAVDASGRPTQDANAAALLQPIGDYKGFGLAMMVDILCGVLTGMPFGRAISRMYADPLEEKRQLGHFFVALQPEAFLPAGDFARRLKQMMDEVRAEPPLDSGQPVRVPGDPEKQAAAERARTGLPLTAAQWAEFQTVARDAQLPLPVTRD